MSRERPVAAPPTTDAARAVQRTGATPGQPTPQHAVLALQSFAGNAATAAIARQPAVSEPAPQASYADDPQMSYGDGALVDYGDAVSYGPDANDPGSAAYAPGLSPDDQRKLNYARTTLAHVQPLSADDEAVLRKLVPGTLIWQLMQDRDDSRTRLQTAVTEHETRLGKAPPTPSDRHMGPTDPQGDPDIVGGSSMVVSLPGYINDLRVRVEQQDAAIDAACKELGISGEKEFRSMIEERFPKLFLERAKQIAIRMLLDNERIVRAEAERYDVAFPTKATPGAEGPAAQFDKSVFTETRVAAQELHTMQLEIAEEWKKVLEANSAARDENASLADDDDMDWRTSESDFWVPDVSGKVAAASAHHTQLTQAFEARRAELGLKFPIFFQVSDFSKLANGSDNQIRAEAWGKLAEVLGNIHTTRHNIEDGDLKVWHLNDVFEMTMQDLSINAKSPLYAAVEAKAKAEDRKESMVNMAITAVGLAAAIIAALPSAGTSLVVAGTAVAVGTGVYQLSKSVDSYLDEKAASKVSLDPVIADISSKSPDMTAIALDLVGLGLDAVDLAKAIGLLQDAVRAARKTGDLAQLAKTAAAIPELGPGGAKMVLASVGREAEIQEGIVRVIKAVGTRFKPEDLTRVVEELARADQTVISQAFKHLVDSGRVRKLSTDAMEEVYQADEIAELVNAGYMRADGFYDPRNGQMFLKESTFEQFTGGALHEVVHYLQRTHRPAMTRFHEEFEAFSAQRHYLEQLVRSGVDPDLAFPSYKWLLDADSTDKLVAHLRTNQLYGHAVPAGFDFDNAVIDAIADVGRVTVRRGDTQVGIGAAKAPRRRSTKAGIGTVGPGSGE